MLEALPWAALLRKGKSTDWKTHQLFLIGLFEYFEALRLVTISLSNCISESFSDMTLWHDTRRGQADFSASFTAADCLVQALGCLRATGHLDHVCLFA